MRLFKGSLAGLVLAGILTMMPAAAFAPVGAAARVGRGGEHAFFRWWSRIWRIHRSRL